MGFRGPFGRITAIVDDQITVILHSQGSSFEAMHHVAPDKSLVLGSVDTQVAIFLHDQVVGLLGRKHFLIGV